MLYLTYRINKYCKTYVQKRIARAQNNSNKFKKDNQQEIHAANSRIKESLNRKI